MDVVEQNYDDDYDNSYNNNIGTVFLSLHVWIINLNDLGTLMSAFADSYLAYLE